MATRIPIVVHGASGRMGQAILRLARARSDVRIAAALVGPDSASNGLPIDPASPGLGYASSLADAADAAVLIDFSTPDAFDDALAQAQARGVAFVSGTTGLSDAQHAAMADAAQSIPVLWSANFSVGVAVLTRLVAEAAKLLADWDCEIIEAHHRNKKDAPSGTALSLGRAVADARGVDFDQVARVDRAGIAATARNASDIGFAVIRGGDIVGEHSVLFASDGERVELHHAATDRDIFARGALAAAIALSNAVPGYHDFAETISRRIR